LLSIISGLLLRVAIELAVSRLVVRVVIVGSELLSLEFREDNQVKGLVSFRERGAGGLSATRESLVEAGRLAGTVGGLEPPFGGDSTAEGDHGIVGRELVRLLSDSFLEGLLGGTAGGSSSETIVMSVT